MTLKVGIPCFDDGMMVKDMIRDNRVMWLCKVYVKGRIGMGGCAKHVSRHGWEQGT